jgi:phosphatidylserine/phosphatidylglycerophosphate/cardiolipin synthase-like enzyme
MRIFKKKAGTSVHALSGTYVVLLGMDVDDQARKGLLGFAIHREDHTENERYWLKGFKTFRETEPNPPPGSLVSTLEHPVQAFLWGDYTAKPEHDYTYKVVPMYGQPRNLKEGPSVSLRIQTMVEDTGKHAIYFNRGVAGSQAYARRFGNVSPEKIEDPTRQQEAYAWLSRGLEEAMLRFIGQAKGKRYALRAAVYEFSWAPVLEAFGAASRSGADVKIVYDRRTKGPYKQTEKAARAAKILDLMIPREKGSSYIAHNKFIVLLRDGEPVEVWTGSTNFTKGGIFGQSNVGHIIRDPTLARAYLDYWTRLSRDPEPRDLRQENIAATPDPQGELSPGSLTPLFSPRPDLSALEWYGERLGNVQESAGFTAAFGISSTLVPYLLDEAPDVVKRSSSFLRYVMVESEGSKKKPANGGPSPYDIFQQIRGRPTNRVAVGSILQDGSSADADALGSELHRWLAERLTHLNTHVRYLHTKYLLLDPLSDDPTVISGSANFSFASTKNNDENMVVIRGDKDVADVFLGEFMRLFNHFYFRDVASRQAMMRSGKRLDMLPYLEPTDAWTAPYFEAGTDKFAEREIFAR